MATKQKKQDKAVPSGAKAQSVAAAAEGPSSKVRDLGRYFEDAKTELGKVSWPTKSEIKATSIAVLILVVVMSLFLGIVDQIFAKIIKVILSMGL